MKNILTVSLALLLSFSLYAGDRTAPCRPKKSTVLMSYNVKNGEGMDGQRLYSRTAAVITLCRPDVVALQELDRGTKRVAGADVAEELARITGMKSVFARAIDFGGGEYGVGILSAQAPLRTKSVPLPGREENRVLLMAEFGKYIFCCTHLSLTKEDRLASVAIIDAALREFSEGCRKPVYIAGDWNDTPDSETLSRFRERFSILSDTDAYTFPADKPARTIDYIAIWKGNRFGVRRKPSCAFTPADSLASDHRPVVVGL